MLDQNVFLETLKEVSEIVRTAPTPMSEEDMLSYFSEMELNDAQKEMVIEYLTTDHEEPVPENETDEKGEKVADGPSKSLEMYMEELKGLEDVADERLTDMCFKLLAGEQEMVAELSKAFLADTAQLATDYATDKVDVEDLIQEGNLAVFVRLSELLGMGEECGLDVVEEIKEAVNEAMKNYSGEITGEEDGKNAIAGKMNLVNEAIRNLTAENGKQPDMYELSEYTHLSLEELSDITAEMEKLKNSQKK